MEHNKYIFLGNLESTQQYFENPQKISEKYNYIFFAKVGEYTCKEGKLSELQSKSQSCNSDNIVSTISDTATTCAPNHEYQSQLLSQKYIFKRNIKTKIYQSYGSRPNCTMLYQTQSLVTISYISFINTSTSIVRY